MAQPCPYCGHEHGESAQLCPTTGRPIAGDPKKIGTVVANRYVLVRLLGDGGVGAVYKAADQTLRRFVALKVLHPAVAVRARAVSRFEREARATAAIGHPNIVDILDFAVTEKGAPFLVMEYLRGRSLAQTLAAEPRLAVNRACCIAAHALAGLAAAHERGVVHRDLKPANFMLVHHLGDADFVKILDFGFAALLSPDGTLDEPGRMLTPVRTLVGTPAYAAPERLAGDNAAPVGPAADIYSMGVVLFEMLAGTRPFRAPTFRELAALVKTGELPSLLALRPDVPPRLVEVIETALSKDPRARWSSAAAFAAALVPFGGREVYLRDADQSDVFTMDLLRIRVREDQSKRFRLAHVAPPAPADDFEEAPTEKASVPPMASVTVAGFLVHALVRFVARRFGEQSVPLVLESLPATFSGIFKAGVRAEDWVCAEAVRSLLQHIDLQLGRDDLRLVVECGVAFAEGAQHVIRAAMPEQLPKPRLFLHELARVYQALFDGVALKVIPVGDAIARVELVEHGPPSIVGCVATLGFLDRAIRIAGAREAEVNLLRCRALGDAECEFELSWLE